MKILYIISSLNVGGAEVLLQRSVNFLVTHHKIKVVFLKGDGELRNLINESVDVEKVGWSLGGVRQTHQIIKDFRPDIIHTHLLPADTYLLILSSFIKCKVFSTIHNIGKGKPVRDWVAGRIYKLLECRFKSRLKFLCISQAVKKYLIASSGISDSSAEVVYNGVPLLEYSDRIRNPGKLRLLWVGRLVTQKDPIFVLDVCLELRKKKLDFSLTIVGDGPLRIVMEETAKQRGLSEYICFVGEQQNPNRFYLEADLLLVTSKVEGFGLVAIEAMALGTCVITRPVGGLNEIIEHGVSGFLEDTPRKFSSVIEAISGRQVDLAKMSVNSRRKVERDFDLQKSLNRLCEFYEA